MGILAREVHRAGEQLLTPEAEMDAQAYKLGAQFERRTQIPQIPQISQITQKTRRAWRTERAPVPEHGLDLRGTDPGKPVRPEAVPLKVEAVSCEKRRWARSTFRVFCEICEICVRRSVPPRCRPVCEALCFRHNCELGVLPELVA